MPQGSPSGDDQREQAQQHILFVGFKRALIGAGIAGGLGLLGQFLVGRVYTGVEARRLLEASIPSARSVGTGIVTATATILALMLTMLGLTRHATGALESTFFKQVKRIGQFASVGLIGGTMLLVLLSFPVTESSSLPDSWYAVIYYVLIAITALLAGVLIFVVLLLYSAIDSLIAVVRPGVDVEEE